MAENEQPDDKLRCELCNQLKGWGLQEKAFCAECEEKLAKLVEEDIYANQQGQDE